MNQDEQKEFEKTLNEVLRGDEELRVKVLEPFLEACAKEQALRETEADHNIHQIRDESDPEQNLFT